MSEADASQASTPGVHELLSIGIEAAAAGAAVIREGRKRLAQLEWTTKGPADFVTEVDLIPMNLDGFRFSDAWQSGTKRQVLSRLAADFTAWQNDGARFKAEFDRVIPALIASDGGSDRPPPSLL
jgi:hypothetical protein